MSGHQLGSANGSATVWRGRRWRLLRCRADIAPGFSAPSGREGHHPAHPAGLGHPNGQGQDPRAAAPQLADPVRHVGHRGEALASLGPAGPRAPTPMLVTARPRRPGVEELMPTCREERDPAAVAACVGDQVAQRPRRPTWPSATCDRWTNPRTRGAPDWARASSARGVPWPRRRRVPYKQVTEVVDLHAKDPTGPSSRGQP
jgi:hypothetical protein